MRKKDFELEVIATVGIPASGKSTWSLEKLKIDPRNPDAPVYVRVCRDDYRFMLKDAPVTEPKVEDMITKLVYQAIDVALSKRLNVIVDQTNLTPEYIEALAEHVKYKANFRVQLFDISLEKALERDALREKKVGEQVIRKMWKQYRSLVDSHENSKVFNPRKKQTQIYTNPVFDPNLEEVILCDLDGTLAHMNGKRGPFEWLKTDVDDLDEIVARTIKDHMTLGHKIIFMSGRSEEGRVPTEQWLEFYGFKYHALLMRKKTFINGAGIEMPDNRKDNIIKEELYNEHIKGKYNVRHVYDDRNQVVKMWRSLGIKVYQVQEGDF
jgi:predicted kinase